MALKKNILFVIFFCFCTIANAQYTKLFDFTGSATGSAPFGSLISDGTFLYGMTRFGGTSNTGTIFKINIDGTGYVKLKDLDSASGYYPEGSLISDGTFLYGMASRGGINNAGVIFKMNANGTGYTKLHDFDCIDGCTSVGSLMLYGQDLFGMTNLGGTVGKGVIFKIMTDGTGFFKIHEFLNFPTGFQPYGSLISDSTFLYGMTNEGGVSSLGVIFKIKHDGTGYTKLMDFTGANGSKPYGSLIFDGTFLYGITEQGGVNNEGIIFKIKPDGTGYTKIMDFNGANGTNPRGSLLYDGTYLYAMAPGGPNGSGLLFRIKPDGTGYAVVCDLIGVLGGIFLNGTPIIDGAYFYGMTVAGAPNDLGTIFKCGNTVGVSENAKTNIKIFPNPITSILNIIDEQNELQNSTIEIKNYLGQTVYDSPFDSQINLSHLSSGMYFLTLQNGNSFKTVKIVKQ